MKKLFLFLCLGISINLHSQTQEDSTKQQHQVSKKEAIYNLRNLLIDNIIDQNTTKIAELTTELNAYENDYYLALYPYERWIISLLTKDYSGLTTALAQIDTAAIFALHKKIQPQNNGLGQILVQRLNQASSSLITDIQSQANLSSEDKSLLLLVIKDLTIKEKNAQTKMNDAASDFLNTFPQSNYELYVKTFVRYEYRTRGFVWGMELFAGASIISGEINNMISNGGLLGLGFIWGIGNFQLNTRYFIGACSLYKDVSYEWQQEMGCSTISPEISASYIFHPQRKITLAPVVGLSWFVIGPPLSAKDKNQQHDDLNHVSAASPILGVDLGWEFYKDYYYNYVFHKTMSRFSSLNVRYCIQQTKFTSLPNNNGIMQTIVLSIKMGISGAKRVY